MIVNENDWTKCVGVSTDCACTMSVIYTELIAWNWKIIPSVTCHNCCIYQVRLENNFGQRCKNCALYKSKIDEFKNLEIRWLSWGKVLYCLFELKDEVRIFFV